MLFNTINLLKPQGDITFKARPLIDNDGVFICLVLALSLLAFIFYFQRKRFEYLVNSFFTIRYFKQLVREDSVLQQRVSIIMLLIFVLVLPLFIFLAFRIYQIQPFQLNGFLLFISCLLGIALLYFVKAVTLGIVGYMLKIEEQMHLYFYNIFITSNFLALFIIPITLFMAYGNATAGKMAFKMGLFIIISVYIYRIIRTLFMTIGNKGISIYHLFLYFCTLEIIPILILFKIGNNLVK